MITTPSGGTFTLSLFSMDCKDLGNINLFLDKGSNIASFHHSELASGIYLMRVSGESDVVSKKIYLSKNV